MNFLSPKGLLGIGNRILHPIDPAYFEHTPPALIAAVPMLLFAGLMLVLSIRERR